MTDRKTVDAEHWDTINNLSGRMSASEANISQLEKLVESGFAKTDRMLSSIQDQLSRPATPTNWIGIGALLLSGMAAVGTYTNKTIEPISARVDREYQVTLAQQKELVDRARWMGEQSVRTEWLESKTERTLQHVEDILSNDLETGRKIDNDVRERVLLRGFSRDDGDRIIEDIRRLQENVSRIDREGTKALRESQK